jgi:pre-mRNA-processing factor SLU7
MQLFAWQSENRGNDVHTNSNPTQAALVYKDYLQKKEKLKDTSKSSILDRYGGEEHLQRMPQELLSGQTENYIEYDRSGKVVKGQEKAKARSKYDEDIYPGNHKSVWGSWFNLSSFQWGYACCHSYIKASYCAGQAGIEAEKEQAEGGRYITAPPSSAAPTKSLADLHNAKTAADREKERKEFDDKKDKDGTKRKADGIVTEEDMEDYRKKKSRGNFEDPLANVGNEELLPL